VVLKSLKPEKLEKLMHCTTFVVPSGINISVPIGSMAELENEHVADNVVDVVTAVAAAMPPRLKGFANIQTISLRLPITPTLPIYSAVAKAISADQSEMDLDA
jgi:ABC-type dipeptide/oligopeptide/nickel transport system permease component